MRACTNVLAAFLSWIAIKPTDFISLLSPLLCLHLVKLFYKYSLTSYELQQNFIFPKKKFYYSSLLSSCIQNGSHFERGSWVGREEVNLPIFSLAFLILYGLKIGFQTNTFKIKIEQTLFFNIFMCLYVLLCNIR